jgi:hypothetical protein
MVYEIEELKWRAWVTMFDSIIAGRQNWDWSTEQMLEYNTETLLKSKAIYNIDEQLWFPMFKQITDKSIKENNGNLKQLINWSTKAIEIQIFGKDKEKVTWALNYEQLIKKYFNNN